MSKQVERIIRMESYLDEARVAADDLDQALEAYAAVRKKIVKLEAYYTGRQWMKDFEDREARKLPEDLKCGVLSEDAVYDLLADDRDLALRMSELVKDYLEEH